MSFFVQPGGAGSWQFLPAAINLGSVTCDATEVTKTGSLTNAALDGFSFAIVIAQPSFTWGAGLAASTNIWGYFYLQFGVQAEFSSMFQKFGATNYFPGLTAGANYFPNTQAIVPITFDPATRIYSLNWSVSGAFSFAPAVTNIIADWRIDMIGAISGLATP